MPSRRPACRGARVLPIAVLFAASAASWGLPSGALHAWAEPSPPPVIACTSLANLRMVLRSVHDDAAAAVPIVTDPRSDLGCAPLDRSLVTGVADRIALNGRSYDCLALQNTSLCHWTVAGAVTPPAPRTGQEKPGSEKSASEKGRR